MMKVRVKGTDICGWSGKFNTSGLGEIVVQFDDGSMDSDYARNYDVLINDTWVDLLTSFGNNDVISDNYNEQFREARTDTERVRGWYE